jgi:Derlin-2/3
MDIVETFKSLPVFTRAWLGLTFAITAAVTLDAIPPDQIVLDWHRVLNINSIYHHERFEFWRVLTAFCWSGAPLNELYSLFLLYSIYIHSNGYEKNPFPAGSGSRTADTLFGVLFCVMCLLCTHPLPGYFFGPEYELYPILARNLNGALLYLWSKRNPTVVIQFNFIPMEGRYLPFAHLGISLFMKNRLHELLHGFAVAHFYYYLIAVAPMLLGRRILRAPRILVELIGEGGNDVPEDDHQPNFDRFRNHDNATAAHIAAKLGNLPHLRQLAEAATSSGGEQRLRLLLTASDRNGWQPLHEACRSGHREIVRYLVVEQGHYVDVHATTNSGRTPLSLSQEYRGNDHPVSQLLRQVIASENEAESEGE